MKKFSNVFEGKIEMQDNTLGFVSAADLKKYLTIVDKFLTDEGKEIIQYLIVNNDTYVKDLGDENSTNALAEFYTRGVPSDKPLKELYKNIGTIIKKGRLNEIPVFQTKEQFNGILNKEFPLDEVVLNLTTEKGRNETAKKYDPLVWKIVRQFAGKSNLSIEDLRSAGLEGLTSAMNDYGKKSKKTAEDDEEKRIIGQSFGQFAAYRIRFWILGAIESESRIVRVPKSAQSRERKETGRNTKNNTVSGDDPISKSGDNGNKSYFDMVGGKEDASSSLDKEDLNKLWKKIYDKLAKKFDEKTLNIWMDFNGINGHEKVKNKQLADKYNVAKSSITYYCYLVNNYIRSNKEMFKMFTDVYELMKECKNEEDRERRFDEIVREEYMF